jgi:hypothetical protein
VFTGGAGGGAAAVNPGPATQDEAAKAALNAANPQSIAKNQEFGGVIYRDANGKYGYTGPAGGSDQGFDPSRAPAQPGTTLVGDVVWRAGPHVNKKNHSKMAKITYACPDRQSWRSTQPHHNRIIDANPAAYHCVVGARVPVGEPEASC